MEKIRRNWAKLVFILVPLCVGIVDGAVLIGEKLQPETVKAIRVVRESKSRKENFTVQQYLYTTIYHRRSRGEAINIDGWRAEQPAGPGASVAVEFSYADRSGPRVATWEVDLKSGEVIPRNEAAQDLSWH